MYLLPEITHGVLTPVGIFPRTHGVEFVLQQIAEVLSCLWAVHSVVFYPQPQRPASLLAGGEFSVSYFDKILDTLLGELVVAEVHFLYVGTVLKDSLKFRRCVIVDVVTE